MREVAVWHRGGHGLTTTLQGRCDCYHYHSTNEETEEERLRNLSQDSSEYWRTRSLALEPLFHVTCVSGDMRHALVGSGGGGTEDFKARYHVIRTVVSGIHGITKQNELEGWGRDLAFNECLRCARSPQTSPSNPTSFPNHHFEKGRFPFYQYWN